MIAKTEGILAVAEDLRGNRDRIPSEPKPYPGVTATLSRANRELIPESGPLGAVHLARHKWPKGCKWTTLNQAAQSDAARAAEREPHAAPPARLLLLLARLLPRGRLLLVRQGRVIL